jgi:hypothetical protein
LVSISPIKPSNFSRSAARLSAEGDWQENKITAKNKRNKEDKNFIGRMV